VRSGDILLEISGGSKASGQTTGRSLLVTDDIATDDGRTVIPASFCRLIRLDQKLANPRYVYYHLQEMYQSGRAGRYENQSTGISNFQFKYFLENEQVRLPALPEQARIARVLGSLDDKIENNRRLARTLEEIAATLFKAHFVDFVSHDDLVESEIGPIPRGWRVDEVGEVLRVVGGSTPSTKESVYWDGGTHRWATPKDLSGLDEPIILDTARHITDAGVDRISSGLLPPPTVLMSSRAPVGYTAISLVPIAINQGFIAFPPSDNVPSEYILFWLRANIGRIKAHAGGTTFAEISKRAFRPLPMLLPPMEELDGFRECAEPLISRIAACVRENAVLSDIRDALLPRLTSGQIRVPPDAELASEVR
jgi:type I restriction enzyme S subunit